MQVFHRRERPACKRIKYHDFNQAEKGFSIIEALVALLIVTIVSSLSVSLFIGQHQQNINSEIRTGAIALSQQILDSLRQVNPKIMPGTSGGVPVPGGVTLRPKLTSSASSSIRVLNVNLVDGFVVGQSLVIGSDSANTYSIQSIDSVTKTITLSSGLETAQPVDALVKPISLGYSYDLTVQYCSNANLPCGTSSRNVKVEVAYNAKTVYTVETVYTQLR